MANLDVITPSTESKSNSAIERIGERRSVVIGADKRMFTAPRSAGKLLYVFTNADLRLGHDGLAIEAKKHKTKEFPEGIEVNRFLPGQLVIFVNHRMDKFKVFAAHGVVAYKRLDKGQILDMRVIQYIPQAFNATGKIDYDKALANVVHSAYKELHPRKASKLDSEVGEE